jgi:uncharacterized OB-fold protein
VQKCCDCGHLIFIPQPACYRCLSRNLEWVKGSGRGTVYSYTVVWRPQTPAFEVPYVIAIVDLEEGYQMLTNIVDVDPSQVHVGMPVEVAFRAASEEVVLPYFRPRPSQCPESGGRGAPIAVGPLDTSVSEKAAR